jgi:hypothetical protein
MKLLEIRKGLRVCKNEAAYKGGLQRVGEIISDRPIKKGKKYSCLIRWERSQFTEEVMITRLKEVTNA